MLKNRLLSRVNYCKIINSWYAKFSGYFETLERSFISAFLIFMTLIFINQKYWKCYLFCLWHFSATIHHSGALKKGAWSVESKSEQYGLAVLLKHDDDDDGDCFCGMVDRRKAFSLISSRDHCQRSSPS